VQDITRDLCTNLNYRGIRVRAECNGSGASVSSAGPVIASTHTGCPERAAGRLSGAHAGPSSLLTASKYQHLIAKCNGPNTASMHASVGIRE
jgi:hypothetical protein